ncbi:hypothetical protein, partial [Streptomyces anulatus]|uniref:hypothetical protein n=1 Tax=Streptomyces anulatus TaxID=1892 RepID=UPI0034127C0C
MATLPSTPPPAGDGGLCWTRWTGGGALGRWGAEVSSPSEREAVTAGIAAIGIGIGVGLGTELRASANSAGVVNGVSPRLLS